MAEVGRNVPNTLAKAPITFAMIELAESADCNARKSQWLSYGFKDVTPTFGGQSTVPSLDGSIAAQGRQMLQSMKSVKADWYMISGHHGALYASDYNTYRPDRYVDQAALHNGEEYCGYFNESYHLGRWNNASRSAPDTQATANDIYVRSTDPAPSSIADFVQDNPLFDASSAPTPKGIILSGCNTLIYLSCRKKWSSAFPNAVIIGPTYWIVSGTWVSTAVASAQMTNESFWRDPQSILDQPGMCDQLEQQLTAGFPSSSQIGFIYKGNFYRPGNSQPVGDPLTE